MLSFSFFYSRLSILIRSFSCTLMFCILFRQLLLLLLVTTAAILFVVALLVRDPSPLSVSVRCNTHPSIWVFFIEDELNKRAVKIFVFWTFFADRLRRMSPVAVAAFLLYPRLPNSICLIIFAPQESQSFPASRK